MATGDVKNNLRKLLTELKRVHYPQYVNSDENANGFDIKALANGQPRAFLPILHFIFLDYSYLLAQYLAERDYELYAKTDLRFIEVVYRILRNEFSFKPQLTKEQFLTIGFAEQKIILLCTILKLCQDKLKHLDGKHSRTGESKMKLSCGTRRSLKNNSTAGFPRSSNPTETMKEFVKTSTINTRKSSKQPLFSQSSIIRKVDISDKTSKKSVTSEGGQNRSVASSSNPLVSRECCDVSSASQNENKENRPEGNKNNRSMTRMPRKECFSLTNTCEDNITSAKCFPENEQSFVAVDQEVDKSVNSPWSRLQKKCVRWEDEATIGDHSVTCASRDHFTPAPGFEPLENQTKQSLPVPTVMATVPQPSPDLTLTPISKSKHQLIPISEAKRMAPESCGSNVSLIDITGCDNIKESHVQIVRHSHTAEVMANNGTISGVVEIGNLHGYENHQQEKQSSDDLIKCQLMEIKEELKKLLSLNNHMSTQIVLLETRVKLLEEQQNNFLSSNTENHYKQPNDTVEMPHCSTNKKDKVTLKLTENFEPEIIQMNSNKTSRTSSDESERSLTGSDQESSDENCVVELNVKDQGETTNIVHTPKVTFVDPSTKATVLNVHKRLKETREMLTKTNRSYATRFNQASLSENIA